MRVPHLPSESLSLLDVVVLFLIFFFFSTYTELVNETR